MPRSEHRSMPSLVPPSWAPCNDRAAFLAHVVNGRTHDEVAWDLGVVKRTVQRMIDRATEAVRKVLADRKAPVTG
mgnify:CR=1 FL=1